MASRRVVALFAFLLAVCVIVSIPAFASNARIVRLSYTEGEVRIDRNIGQGLERAILNMPITQGTRLDTGEDGRVEVEFENGSTLRMTGPGSLVFRELSLTGRGDKISYIDVQHGLLYFDIKHKGDDDFRIAFAGQDVRVPKNAHFRLDVSEMGTSVAVYRGEVDVEGLAHEVKVKSNETLSLDPEDRNRYYLAKGINADSEDSWDEQRRGYRDQYASHEQDYKYANSYYGAPYSYGLEDLSYYGSYFNAPGYGWLWRPSAYGPNWDPFSDGAWTWYPGAGWVFISSQPWGWAPYRYGQWVWVNGYGWCWSPARNYNYWNPVPVISHAPPAFLPPTPPRHGGGPTVLIGGGVRTPGPGPTPTPRWPGRRVNDDRGPAGGSGRGTPIWPGHNGAPTGGTPPSASSGARSTPTAPPAPPSGTPGAPVGRVAPPAPKPDRPPAPPDMRRGRDTDRNRDIDLGKDTAVAPRREMPTPPPREVAPPSAPRVTPAPPPSAPRATPPPASPRAVNSPGPRPSPAPAQFSGGGHMGGGGRGGHVR